MKKNLSVLLAIVMILALVAGCATQAPAAEETPVADAPAAEEPAAEEPAAAEEKDSYLIGISTDSGFQARTWECQELYKKAEEAGNVTIIEQAADDDSTVQIQQIKSMVDQGVDAIVVCAVDMNAVGTALDYAAEKGVIVTLYDRFVDHSAVQFCATYDSYTDGVNCGKELMALDTTPDEPKVVFELIGNRGDINAIERHEGFRSVVDEMTNWTIVEIETNWSTEDALTGMQNALQKYPDVWGIFCASSHMDGSIETALTEVGRWAKVGEEGHVNFVSLGGEAPGTQIAVDGYTDKFVVIHFDEMGAHIFDAIMTLLEGGSVENPLYQVSSVVYTKDELIAEKDTLYAMEIVTVP